MTRDRSRSIAAAILCTVLAGCEGYDEAPAGEVPSPEPVYTLSVAEPSPDGTLKILHERKITLSEELAMNAARARHLAFGGAADPVESAAANISRDPTCSNDSLWLNSELNQTGNRVCIIKNPNGFGSALGLLWPIKSYWGGAAAYWVANTTSCQPGQCRTVCSWQRVDVSSNGFKWAGALDNLCQL